METRLVMVLLSVALLVVAAFCSYTDGMFLPSQMIERYRIGFPFIANGAMWGNLILISFVLYIIGKYADVWSGSAIFWTLVAGMIISLAAFNLVYLKGKFPDALAGGGRPISTAGWIIVFYSGLVIAAIILFYLSSRPTTEDVVWVGILLALYILVANHVVLNFLNNWYLFLWCPQIFVEESSPLRLIIGGEILVVVVTAVKLL